MGVYCICFNPAGAIMPRFRRAIKDGASFCYCAYVLRILGYSGFLRNLPPNITIFCAVYDYVEKADLSNGYQNSKRRLGVTTHFSEVIELKFGKKLYTFFVFDRFSV